MPMYRTFGYASSAAAQTAATLAIDELQQTLLAAARAALPATQAASAQAAPITNATILTIEPLPSDPTNYSTVSWQFATPDGRADVVRSVLGKAEAESITTPVTGTATVLRTVFPKARVTLRLVYSVTGTATGDWFIPSGTRLTDTATGKVYVTSAREPASGTNTTTSVYFTVHEEDATAPGDPSYGTPLTANTEILHVSPYFKVTSFYGSSIGGFTALRSRQTGKLYTVRDTASPASYEYKIAGTNSAVFEFYRASGVPNSDLTSAIVGEELELVTPDTNFRPVMPVVSVAPIMIPKDTQLESANARFYRTSVDIVIDDRATVDVPFHAESRGVAWNLSVDDTLAMISPPAGVNSGPHVASVVLWDSDPIAYGAQVIGDAIEWNSRVYRDRDGRWVAEVYSEPPGS